MDSSAGRIYAGRPPAGGGACPWLAGSLDRARRLAGAGDVAAAGSAAPWPAGEVLDLCLLAGRVLRVVVKADSWAGPLVADKTHF
jgi:hypothetical protein